VEGVRGVHDLHVWSISRSLRMLSAHIVVGDIPLSEAAMLQRRLRSLMHERYDIDHSTLQLECEGCDPDALYCDIANNSLRGGH
jgi:cobalt-zinc-cadmium efflux system protein